MIITASVSHGAGPKLSELFAITKAERFVFVQEVPVGNEFGYKSMPKPLGDEGEVKGALAEALKMASEESYTTERINSNSGYMPRLMLLDSNGTPVCLVRVVNRDRTVLFYGLKRKSGEVVLGAGFAAVRSDALTRWVYERVRTKIPVEFKRLQQMSARSGHSLESLLFPKESNESEQGDAANPTPR